MKTWGQRSRLLLLKPEMLEYINNHPGRSAKQIATYLEYDCGHRQNRVSRDSVAFLLSRADEVENIGGGYYMRDSLEDDV